MATWVISIRKSFVVGSISTSECGKAAWHASGSVKQRTLLHATSSLPQKNKTTIWRAINVIGQTKKLQQVFGSQRRGGNAGSSGCTVGLRSISDQCTILA